MPSKSRATVTLSAFADKSHGPTEEDLQAALGTAYDAWAGLIKAVGSRLPGITELWAFASPKTGWGFRLRHRERVILYMTPCRDHFLTSLALGEKAVAEAREAGLPGTLMTAIDAAPRYAEGRGLRVKVNKTAQVPGLAMLAEIKYRQGQRGKAKPAPAARRPPGGTSHKSVYVALLRGINVGRAKRISMGDLRALFEALGHSGVGTVLNSGNVIFTAAGSESGASRSRSSRSARSARLAAAIERAIERELGVSSLVTLLSADELERAVRENPLVAEATRVPPRFLVAFLRDAADRPRVVSLETAQWRPERIAVGTRAAYLWCPDGILDSPLLKAVNRAVGDGMTARNWATVLKLHEGATR